MIILTKGMLDLCSPDLRYNPKVRKPPAIVSKIIAGEMNTALENRLESISDMWVLKGFIRHTWYLYLLQLLLLLGLCRLYTPSTKRHPNHHNYHCFPEEPRPSKPNAVSTQMTADKIWACYYCTQRTPYKTWNGHTPFPVGWATTYLKVNIASATSIATVEKMKKVNWGSLLIVVR